MIDDKIISLPERETVKIITQHICPFCGEIIFVDGETTMCPRCGRSYRTEVSVWQYEKDECEAERKPLWNE